MRLIAASIRNPIAVVVIVLLICLFGAHQPVQAAAAAVSGHRAAEHLDLHRLARRIARRSRSATARAAGTGAAGPRRRRGNRRQRELRRQLHQPDVLDRHRHEGRAGRRDRAHEPHAAAAAPTPNGRSSRSAAAATTRTTRCRGSSCSSCPARRARSTTTGASSRTSIKPRIESVPGVASVNVNAGPPDDVRITVDLAKAAAMGIGFRTSRSRAASPIDVSGGQVEVGRRQYALRFTGRYKPERSRRARARLARWPSGQARRCRDDRDRSRRSSSSSSTRTATRRSACRCCARPARTCSARWSRSRRSSTNCATGPLKARGLGIEQSLRLGAVHPSRGEPADRKPDRRRAAGAVVRVVVHARLARDAADRERDPGLSARRPSARSISPGAAST